MSRMRSARCRPVSAFPQGTYVVWSGQYEYLERAAARLKIVVPVTLAIIFLLLYLNFRSVAETMIVMLSLPFALVGGLWLMWALGFNLSVAVAVGFIALAGVAAETGVVMLIYLNHALDGGAGRAVPPRDGASTATICTAPIIGRRGRARPAEDDDGGRHHGRAAADPVEHRHRLRDHAAHRGADDRRHDLRRRLLTLIVIPAIFAIVKGGAVTGRSGSRLAATCGITAAFSVRLDGEGTGTEP